ncbi:hypothetical protein T11_4924 [Trichinella zimbabwensis]|uniref:Uncharacterized protein n=1 Tax=Trichinella zimbabwensis TaxID=268475 RepID=A0A0V1HJF0_9BILA|nr:hypothetical protein T11_4924 [Trichinella zimbabwensis]
MFSQSYIPLAFPTAVLSHIQIIRTEAVSKCRVPGMLFSLRQCFYWRLEATILKEKYDSKPSFALKMHILPLHLSKRKKLEPNVVELFNYFEDTWIGRLRRQNRQAPYSPINIWNVFEAVTSNMARTNNDLEGWHRAFSNTIGCRHPSVWKFNDVLKKEHGLNMAKIEQLVAKVHLRLKGRNIASLMRDYIRWQVILSRTT